MLPPRAFEERAQGRYVVVRERHRALRDGGRHAGRIRDPQGHGSRARLHEQEVGMPVVAPLELHDHVTPREAARRAYRGHRGLGAARHRAHHLHRGIELDERLGEAHLELGRSSEARPVRSGLGDGPHDRRVRVAQDHRPPGADVVRVLGAVGAPEVGARRARHEDGRAADGAERAHGAVHAAGDHALGAFEELLGFRVGHERDLSRPGGRFFSSGCGRCTRPSRATLRRGRSSPA